MGEATMTRAELVERIARRMCGEGWREVMKDDLGKAMSDARLWLLKAVSDLENAQNRHGTAYAVDVPIAIRDLQAAADNACRAVQVFEAIPQLRALAA